MGERGMESYGGHPSFNYPPGRGPERLKNIEIEDDDERGIFVQETDRAAAAKIRGEKLTEAEFAERAKAIHELRMAANEWIDNHVGEDGWKAGELRALTDYLSREHADTVKQITKNYLNETMYDKRPVVKLMLREIGGIRPDIFIFGWRGKDHEQWNRETKIHDHADATVALTIHEGLVEETVYLIKPEEWVYRMPDQTMSYLGRRTKEYVPGKSKTYKSPPPYLHTVGGSPKADLTVTIHAYLRPTTKVAYDFKIDGDKLIALGVS